MQIEGWPSICGMAQPPTFGAPMEKLCPMGLVELFRV